MNIKRCHIATHTKQQTENKQERQMDKQMGKDGKLTRATELGYICWWRWAPWAEHRGVTPEHSQVLSSDGCRDVVLGTSCRSCSSTPALRDSFTPSCLTTRGCLSHRPYTRCVWPKKLWLPEWFFLPLPVLALRSKPSAPIQAPASPELKSTRIQGTHCLNGHQLPCCHSLQANWAAEKTRRA